MYIFVNAKKQINQFLLMLDKCKVTEIFCIADDFSKEFEKNNQFYALEPGPEGKKHRKRMGMMSDSEIIHHHDLFPL